MPDDRPADTATDQLATLQSAFDDFRSTALARMSRRPTGDIEQTMRSTAKADTVLAQGQTVNRADLPGLWQWAQDNALVGAGVLQFGVGNGTTTFTLPNYAGRVLIGAGTLGADTYAVGATGGASSQTLVTANLPGHVHNVGVATHGNHGHNLTGGTVPNGGNHGNHVGQTLNAASGGIFTITADNTGNNSGDHGHGAVAVFADPNSAGSHGVTEDSIGSGTGFDNRPPFAAVNVLIWT